MKQILLLICVIFYTSCNYLGSDSLYYNYIGWNKFVHCVEVLGIEWNLTQIQEDPKLYKERVLQLRSIYQSNLSTYLNMYDKLIKNFYKLKTVERFETHHKHWSEESIESNKIIIYLDEDFQVCASSFAIHNFRLNHTHVSILSEGYSMTLKDPIDQTFMIFRSSTQEENYYGPQAEYFLNNIIRNIDKEILILLHAKHYTSPAYKVTDKDKEIFQDFYNLLTLYEILSLELP